MTTQGVSDIRVQPPIGVIPLVYSLQKILWLGTHVIESGEFPQTNYICDKHFMKTILLFVNMPTKDVSLECAKQFLNNSPDLFILIVHVFAFSHL